MKKLKHFCRGKDQKSVLAFLRIRIIDKNFGIKLSFPFIS